MKIYLAEGAPELRLNADEAIPSSPPDKDFPMDQWILNQRAVFASQAGLIADALFASLPGGTIDALLVEMLDRKRSLLRIRP